MLLYNISPAPGKAKIKGVALDHDDFGSNRSKVMNVIDSNSLARDAGEKVLTHFLIPPWRTLRAIRIEAGAAPTRRSLRWFHIVRQLGQNDAQQ